MRERSHTQKSVFVKELRIPHPATTSKAMQYQQKMADSAQKNNQKGQCVCNLEVDNDIKTVNYRVQYTPSSMARQLTGYTKAEYRFTQLEYDKVCTNLCSKEQNKINTKKLAEAKMQQSDQLTQTAATTSIAVAVVGYAAHRLFRICTQKSQATRPENKTTHQKQYRAR